MIAIIIVLAGFAVIFGTKNGFDRMIRLAVGLAIMLPFIPGIVSHVAFALYGRRVQDTPGLPSTHQIVAALVCISLTSIGFIVWKSRGWRARGIEAERRKHGRPRDRALPPPPRHPDDV